MPFLYATMAALGLVLALTSLLFPELLHSRRGNQSPWLTWLFPRLAAFLMTFIGAIGVALDSFGRGPETTLVMALLAGLPASLVALWTTTQLTQKNLALSTDEERN